MGCCAALQLWNKYLGERRLACRGLKVTDPALERLCDTYERALVSQPTRKRQGTFPCCIEERNVLYTWPVCLEMAVRGIRVRSAMQLDKPGSWMSC